MVSDINLHQQQPMEPEQVQVTDKTNKQTAKLSRQKSATLQDDQGSIAASSTQSASQRSKAVKQLSFRIDENTHHRISLASQRADKSINAWMEEVLSAAADDILERVNDASIDSVVIQKLLEHPDYATRLIEGVTPYLRDSDPPTIFQFSNALKRLMVGWDMMLPLLEEAGTDQTPALIQSLSKSPRSITELFAAVSPFLKEADSVTVRRFNAAFKKLLLGFSAVLPFVKERKNDNMLQIAVVIENLLGEIANDSSAR